LWSWSCSWIYDYLCNRCLSPLTLWVRTSLRWVVLDKLFDQVYQWLAACQWFSLVSSTNKTDRHNIAKILLKVALNTITYLLNSYLDIFWVVKYQFSAWFYFMLYFIFFRLKVICCFLDSRLAVLFNYYYWTI
jgi:uncharacterized membrane protein YidH (DUF202 family)